MMCGITMPQVWYCQKVMIPLQSSPTSASTVTPFHGNCNKDVQVHLLTWWWMEVYCQLLHSPIVVSSLSRWRLLLFTGIWISHNTHYLYSALLISAGVKTNLIMLWIHKNFLVESTRH